MKLSWVFSAACLVAAMVFGEIAGAAEPNEHADKMLALGDSVPFGYIQRRL